MFFFKLLKFSCVAAISFNFWSLFWQIACRFPGFFPVYWGIFSVLTLIHLGLMTEAAQEKVADNVQENRTDLAFGNYCAFFSCLFAAIGSFLGVIL